MNKEPLNHHELHRLFAAKADGVITAGEHDRLTALLKGSVEVRQRWYAFQDIETGLFAWSQSEQQRRSEAPVSSAAPLPRGGKETGSRQVRLKVALLWPLATVAVCVVMIALIWPETGSLPAPVIVEGPGRVVRDEATTSSVAVLTRGVNLKWAGAGPEHAVNAPLAPGWLRLEGGVAEIEFFHGARLCVEGPAEIQLISAGEAYCTSGRFSAHVPPQARGFRLGTPNGDVVDLGTDFGLDLNSKTPEVHVFNGEVELHQPQAEMRLLTGGEAAGFARQGPLRSLPVNDAAFAFSRDLDARVVASQKELFEGWQKEAAFWNDDARLKLRLDFQEGAGSRSVRNVSLHGGDVAAGSIVGCTWTQGRWPGKQALQFRSLSDRVRLGIPGEYRQLTLAAWVQLHGLNIRQSSLCMSQGIENGYVHWQVLHDGSLCLGIGAVAKPEILWDDYITPVIFTPERFGQWIHLAVVYDTAGGGVRFYVDGRLLSTHPLRRPIVLAPGIVELGNWTPSPDRRQQPVRNFVGCMDDFSFFSAALSEPEIRRLAGGL